MRTYDTRDAAEYVGMKLPTFKWYIYRADDSKKVQPDGKTGSALFFYPETLDKFKSKSRPGRGRPKGRKNKVRDND